MVRGIDYGNLMHQAMRGLIRSVLEDVAENGLPGDHHFFITFDTQAEGVNIAGWLKERYPQEMTVVLQHEFGRLTVSEDGFSVSLSFGNKPELLIIPFDAVRTFVDPSVEFGLRFESQDGEEDDDLDEDDDGGDDDPPSPRPAAEVVSLDRFRKS